ncbi:MAG: peptide chain release factor 1, partial [Candidatus Aenigmarchaeota archaeon CG15_BIG_FIL_POST_REV_8_21_14_020_37_27]
MVFNEESQVRLKKLFKVLEKIRGRHTELISLYIPAGYNVVEIQNMLRSEYALTQNVKSRQTRNNVLNALEKIMNHLKVIGRTPQNGLIVFCGNVSEKEGQADMQIWSVEPPLPLSQKIYWCDQTFILDPLRDMLREKEVYGLIVIDGGGADIGFLKGKKVSLEKHINSMVPGKTAAGGWSQMRYLRIREEAKNDHMKKVAEIADDMFLKEKDLKGVIIGGPGPFKDKFSDGEFLNYQLRKKQLGVVDTSYTGIQGLQEIIQRGEDLIKEASAVKERKLMEEFFSHLQKDDGLSVYGLEEVKKAMNMGAIEMLLISEDYSWVRLKLKCQCGNEIEKDTKHGMEHKCPNCGAKMDVLEERELIEILPEEVGAFSSNIQIISSDSSEGEQFKNLGGIGAILRFK